MAQERNDTGFFNNGPYHHPNDATLHRNVILFCLFFSSFFLQQKTKQVRQQTRTDSNLQREIQFNTI
jgi:hypothetical protein